MNTSQTFDTALAWIFRAEGGYVDDPGDPGRATQYGISLRWLKRQGKLGDIDHDGDVDADDIRALTKDQAAEFYHGAFWVACRCYELPPPIAVAVFDGAVNAGVGTAAKLLQQALHVTADGIIGPATLRAARYAHVRSEDGGYPLLSDYLGRRARYYHDITLANASLARYLRGWMNRLFELQQHLLLHP